MTQILNSSGARSLIEQSLREGFPNHAFEVVITPAPLGNDLTISWENGPRRSAVEGLVGHIAGTNPQMSFRARNHLLDDKATFIMIDRILYRPTGEVKDVSASASASAARVQVISTF